VTNAYGLFILQVYFKALEYKKKSKFFDSISPQVSLTDVLHKSEGKNKRMLAGLSVRNHKTQFIKWLQE
jgi:hypothetical protein